MAAVRDEDPEAQHALEEEMGLRYRSGVGELIFPMVAARPDLVYVVTRLPQHNACQHRLHVVLLCHCIRHVCESREDGVCYWRAQSNMMRPVVPPPRINSNMHYLLLDGQPAHGLTEMHGYMAAEWATCPITR